MDKLISLYKPENLLEYNELEDCGQSSDQQLDIKSKKLFT